MENGGTAFRTSSKLEVFAPKPSSLNQSNLNFNQIAEKLQSEQATRPQISQPNSDDAQTGIGPVTLSTPQPDSTVAYPVKRSGLSGLFARMPSWLVSFVLHLGLILILAIFTFAVPQDRSIFFEIGQSPAISPQTMSIELELDEADFEDTSESLDSQEAELELPLVELFDTPVEEEVFEGEDPYQVTELAEFAQAEPKKPESVASSGSLDNEGDSEGSGALNESDGSADFFGTKSYGSDFVFVIDCSSSMSQNSRWYRAVNELLSTLDELDSDQNFLVLLYNDRTYMMWNAPMTQPLVPANDANKLKIRTWLRQAYPFSGTQPASAVQLALKKKPDAIYFLSDGELRDNTMSGLRTWNRPKRGADSKLRKTPIHTILLGSVFGQKTMRTIAEENNGIFTFVR